jgi:hypothetical protein
MDPSNETDNTTPTVTYANHHTTPQHDRPVSWQTLSLFEDTHPAEFVLCHTSISLILLDVILSNDDDDHQKVSGVES